MADDHHVHMPSILPMDWQVAWKLEIRVLDVVMQVGVTESKDARVVLQHKYFKICETSSQTSHIGVVDSRGGGDLDLEFTF